jgi:hypothetical protein
MEGNTILSAAQAPQQYRAALADLRERGLALRRRMIAAGWSQYARKLAAWDGTLADESTLHRIRMVGLGRAQHYDRELLERCERLAAERLATPAKLKAA